MSKSYLDDYDSEYNIFWQEEVRKRKARKLGMQIGGVVVGSAIAISLLVGSYIERTKVINVDVAAILNVTAAETVFDEIVDKYDYLNPNIDPINIDTIEQNIALSEELSALDLKELSKGLNPLSVEEQQVVDSYTDDVILEMIRTLYTLENADDVTSEIQRDYLIRSLNYKRIAVNNYIYGNGYQQLERYILYLVKSRVIDACDFSITSISNLEIGPSMGGGSEGSAPVEISYTDRVIGKTYIVKISDSGSDIYWLVQNLYAIQNNLRQVRPVDDAGYNKDRNELMLQTINLIKSVMANDYTLDGDKIKETMSRSEVKEKVEKLILVPKTNEE